MTSSPEAGRRGATGVRDELPPALSSMWRLCKLGYRHEPRLLLVSFVLSLLAALPDALLALWLKFLGQGVLDGNRALVVTAALGLGVSATATWFLRTVSTRIQRRFRDRVTIALESHVAGLQASVATIAHQERPEYLDRLSVLRDQVFVLDHMYMSLFTTAGWILRLVVTIGLLVSIHPALALLAVFALPTVLTSTWRPGVERTAEERGAAANRLARHLFVVATTAPPGKEVRVTGLGPRLVEERRAVDQDLSAGGLVELAQQLDQRRLAGAVFTDDGDNGSGGKREVDVVQDETVAARVGERQALDADAGTQRIGRRQVCLGDERCRVVLQPGQTPGAVHPDPAQEADLADRGADVGRQPRAGGQDEQHVTGGGVEAGRDEHDGSRVRGAEDGPPERVPRGRTPARRGHQPEPPLPRCAPLLDEARA